MVLLVVSPVISGPGTEVMFVLPHVEQTGLAGRADIEGLMGRLVESGLWSDPEEAEYPDGANVSGGVYVVRSA